MFYYPMSREKSLVILKDREETVKDMKNVMIRLYEYSVSSVLFVLIFSLTKFK